MTQENGMIIQNGWR